MPAIDPLYDLVLMLDSAAPDDQRQKVTAMVQETINAGGEIMNSQDWGVRQTSYEIRHKTDAEYHLLQFHATPEILERLQRTLRITDGVVRFRIIKLKPGTPAPPASRPEPRPTGITEAAAAAAEPTPAAAAVAVAEPEVAAAVAVAEPEVEVEAADQPVVPAVPADDAE